MGGKNRAKKLASTNGSSTTKKSSAIKVSNKSSNKAAKHKGQKDLEARGGNVESKKAKQASNKNDRATARKGAAAEGKGENAEARKKKRSHGNKSGSSGPSVQQMKQHAHEPRAMSKHDAAYNARQQAKADKRAAGDAEGEEEGEEEEAEPESNAADQRFFERNEHLAGFLDNLNADDLNWSKEERAKPKPKFPVGAGPKKGAAAVSSDEGSDDEDNSGDESDSEDEAPAKKKARGERGVASFERAPRLPSWAADSKAAKDRMPVRTADGSWGASEVTKADTLRARAERLEKIQRKQETGEPDSEDEERKQAAASDDEDMADADASASEGEGDAQDDEEFDDEIPDEAGEDDEDLEAELEMEEVHVEAPAHAPLPPHQLKEQQEKRVRKQQQHYHTQARVEREPTLSADGDLTVRFPSVCVVFFFSNSV